MLTKALFGNKQPAEKGADPTAEPEEWSAPEYDASLLRALKISTCPVVPFFGAYLKELRNILSSPSLVVMSSSSEQQQLQVCKYLRFHGHEDLMDSIVPYLSGIFYCCARVNSIVTVK